MRGTTTVHEIWIITWYVCISVIGVMVQRTTYGVNPACMIMGKCVVVRIVAEIRARERLLMTQRVTFMNGKYRTQCNVGTILITPGIPPIGARCSCEFLQSIVVTFSVQRWYWRERRGQWRRMQGRRR